MTPPPPPPPPRTPSRYNLRRRPSTATPVQNTPRMLRCLDAEEQLLRHPPSEPRLLRSAKKKRPVTADPSVRRPTPQPRRPSTAPLAAVPTPPSPPNQSSLPSNQSSLPSNQPLAAEPNVTTPPVRHRRPSTAPPSDRVLRSASRSRRRDQSQEPIRRSSRKSGAPHPQPPSRKRLTARARAFLPHPLKSDNPEEVDNARHMATQRGRSRSRSKTRSRPPQTEGIAPKRERSRPRSQARTIRTRSQTTANAAKKASTENDVSPGAEELGDTMRRLFHGTQRTQSSSPDFSEWPYHDLVEECKKNGLPCRGKKDEVVSRLQRFHTRSAGALARRTPVETRSSVKSRSSVLQDTLDRNVSSSKLSSEREKVSGPEGDEQKGYEQGTNSTEMKVENKTDLTASHHHIGVQGESKPPFNSGQENHKVSEHQKIAVAYDCAAKILSENGRDRGESPGSKEKEMLPKKRNCSDVPLVEKVEDRKQLSSSENHQEQAIRLDIHQNRDNDSTRTQQLIPTDKEENPAKVPAKECVDSEGPLDVNENGHPSTPGENSESPEQHISDVEQNEASSLPNKACEANRADPPSPKANMENVTVSRPSTDEEIEAQSPHETPVPSPGPIGVKAIDLAHGNVQESHDAKSVDRALEDTAKHPEVAMDDLTNYVETVCQRINNVGAIQFEPAKEHTVPIQTPVDAEDNEFQFGSQHIATEAKDCSLPNRVSSGAVQASLPECESRVEQVNEADIHSGQEASQSPLQPEPRETAMREMFSRWRRPPIEKKEVAQTPDVIDLDAESDGNDDDEEEDSRHGNSDSRENSADESQRPDTVVAADDDDHDDNNDHNQAPRHEDVNQNKLPDTDEDNDEDEDDDDDSDANDDSPRNDACELTADDGEGPHPMDVTFSEQGEERQGKNFSSQRKDIPSVKANAHDNVNSEDEDESKASPLDGMVLLSQTDVVEREGKEQFQTLDSTEQDGDDVIDLQEDSRMGEDEEEDEELDYGDDSVMLNEGPGDVREKAFSITEKRKGDSVLRAKGDESHGVIVPDSSEVDERKELTANEKVESSSHNDTVQKPSAASDGFEGEENVDYFSSPDVKRKVIDLMSADEKEVDDHYNEKTVGQKGIIKPKLKRDDISLSDEGDMDESSEGKAVAQTDLSTRYDAQEEEDQAERGDELRLSPFRETQEMEEPCSVNLVDRESPKIVGVVVSPTESPKFRSHPTKLDDERSHDDLEDFSESPLPSPIPPRSPGEGLEDDGLSNPVGQIASEAHGDSVVDNMDESEAPENPFEDDKSEILDENYPSSELSRAAEDRSHSIAELGSDEEQELSSPLEDPGVVQHEQGQNSSSRVSTPEVHEFTDNPSPDPGQHEDGIETPEVGPIQHRRFETSRGSSPEVHAITDNFSSDPGDDQGENECQDDESPDVICIVSSDDDDPVDAVSAEAVVDEMTNKSDMPQQKGPDMNEGLRKAEEEDKGTRDVPLRKLDVRKGTSTDAGLASKEHLLYDGFDDDRKHHPLTGPRNRSSPLPSDLVQKTSQTASRSGNMGGFSIPLMQRSDSAFSASLKVPTSVEESEKLPSLNSMLPREQKVQPWGGKAPRDLQTSTRPNSDLMRGRMLNDNNEYKLLERDTLSRHQNLTEERAIPKVLHGNAGKRPFEQMQQVRHEDQRPRKIRKKQKMVQFVPMPTPENTIQAFGQQQMMNGTQDNFQQEQQSSSILHRLKKIREVDQGSAFSFRLPPLTATLGQVYNPHQSEPVMFRQGSITSIPKRGVRGRRTRDVPEYDKMSFLEESRRRLEAHKRRAPSLQYSRSPFATAPTKPSSSPSSRAKAQGAACHRQSQAHFPPPPKRVTFQTEAPPFKRRKGTSSR